VLFDVFKLLPKSRWFSPPYPDLISIKVCKKSGFKAGEFCETPMDQRVQRNGKDSPFCPYCRLLKLDKSEEWQVNGSCESIENMRSVHWFVLPPVMEYYYKGNTPSYKKMPPYRKDCKLANVSEGYFDVIYPSNGSRLFIPTEGDGKPGQVVVQVASRDAEAPLFWYLDGVFLKKTVGQHQLALRPEKGKHSLNIGHVSGQNKTVYFEVVN
jgi:penicillin-binding protein 1C